MENVRLQNLRVIEFRGKTVKGEWHYGDLWQLYDKEKNRYVGVIIPHDTNDFSEVNYDFVVNPKSIGQYTGIHDKHCKRIYEGDIVRHVSGFQKKDGEWVDTEEDFVVSFRDGSFNIAHLCLVTESLEIIGNIIDNPNYGK